MSTCQKFTCGAEARIGEPCTDHDCPQRVISVEDYQKLRSAIITANARLARLGLAVPELIEAVKS